MTIPKPRRVGAFLAATALLVLAACGSDSAKPAATTTTAAPAATDGPATSTTAKPVQPVTIHFGASTASLAALPWMVAIASGTFEDERIVLKTDVLAGALTMTAVQGGAVDIGQVSIGEVFALKAAGQDITAIGIIGDRIPSIITLSNDAIKKSGVSPKASVADRVKGLKGLTLGVTSLTATTTRLVQAMLVENGLAADAVNFQAVPQAGLVNAMRAGQIDGFTLSPPDSLVPSIEGFGGVWINFAAGEYPPTVGPPVQVLVTTGRYLKANPDAVRRFLSALWSANTLIAGGTTPTVRNAVAAKWFPDMKADVFNAGYTAMQPVYSTGLLPTEAGFKSALDTYNATAKDKATLTFLDVFDLTLAKASRH